MALTPNATKLIIVEGKSDTAFFKELLKQRKIKGFDVFCPWDMGNKEEGEDAIKTLLNVITLHPNFTKIKKILIVVDSDDDPKKKFKKFQTILRKTDVFSGRTEKYPVPTALSTFASAANCPDVAISLLPNDTSTGAMETLCYTAALPTSAALVPCINNLVNCIGANSWSPQKNAKLKLRTLISSQYSKNPDIPTTILWEKAPNIVPLNSNNFDDLADFLAGI